MVFGASISRACCNAPRLLPAISLAKRTMVTTVSKNPFNMSEKRLINLNPAQIMNRTPLVIPSAGMKYVGTPRKRCHDCYYYVEDERLYVGCNTHPRHKQGSRIGRPRYHWIMTHATQGASCRGNGKGRREMWTQQGLRMDF